jgi:hypothetical protein
MILSAKFGSEVTDSIIVDPFILDTDIKLHNLGEVAINLRYYLDGCECFSEWQHKDLKKFTATIKKLRSYTKNTLKTNKSLCDVHKGKPSVARFKRPDSISAEIQFYEIKVDPSNKARIHGFFIEDTFFLVWLDRNHLCFKA